MFFIPSISIITIVREVIRIQRNRLIKLGTSSLCNTICLSGRRQLGFAERYRSLADRTGIERPICTSLLTRNRARSCRAKFPSCSVAQITAGAPLDMPVNLNRSSIDKKRLHRIYSVGGHDPEKSSRQQKAVSILRCNKKYYPCSKISNTCKVIFKTNGSTNKFRKK